MDYFVPEDKAVVWRGPMLHKAIEQFLTDVFWDSPDYLIVDMPPGTGDIAISMSQFLAAGPGLAGNNPSADRPESGAAGRPHGRHRQSGGDRGSREHELVHGRRRAAATRYSAGAVARLWPTRSAFPSSDRSRSCRPCGRGPMQDCRWP